MRPFDTFPPPNAKLENWFVWETNFTASACVELSRVFSLQPLLVNAPAVEVEFIAVKVMFVAVVFSGVAAYSVQD